MTQEAEARLVFTLSHWDPSTFWQFLPLTELQPDSWLFSVHVRSPLLKRLKGAGENSAKKGRRKKKRKGGNYLPQEEMKAGLTLAVVLCASKPGSHHCPCDLTGVEGASCQKAECLSFHFH